MTNQLSLSFPQNDDRPLPLIVAERWDFPLAYVDRDGNIKNYLYAAQDWIKGLGGNNPTWSRLKKQLFISVEQLPYKARDSKTYKVDFIAEVDLYRCSIEMRAMTKRPQVEEIHRYLAESGVLVDLLHQDPEVAIEFTNLTDPETLIHASMDKWRKEGKTDSWIEARIRGIVTRKQFTEALRDAVLNAPMSLYGQATDKVYKGLWQRTTAQLRGDLQLRPQQNIRDHFGEFALIYTGLAERVAAKKLGDMDIVPIDLAMDIVHTSAKLISKQAKATSKELGIDLVTERPLLARGK